MFWLAQPPKRVVPSNTLSIHMVVVTDTKSEESSISIECKPVLRYQQLYYMFSRNFDDIAFNFMIGGDGNVYTGRGWDLRGAHTKGHDTGTLGIALIGNFSTTLPREVQVEAFNKLVTVGVRTKNIATNYTLVNYCQLRVDGYFDLALATNMTSCPHFDRSYPLSRCALKSTKTE